MQKYMYSYIYIQNLLGPGVHSRIERILLYLVFLYRESTVVIREDSAGLGLEPPGIERYWYHIIEIGRAHV